MNLFEDFNTSVEKIKQHFLDLINKGEVPIMVKFPNDMPKLLEFLERLLEEDEIKKNVTFTLEGTILSNLQDLCFNEEEDYLNEHNQDDMWFQKCKDYIDIYHVNTYEDFKYTVLRNIKHKRTEKHTMDLLKDKVVQYIPEHCSSKFKEFIDKFTEEEPLLSSYLDFEFIPSKQYLKETTKLFCDLQGKEAEMLDKMNLDIITETTFLNK